MFSMFSNNFRDTMFVCFKHHRTRDSFMTSNKRKKNFRAPVCHAKDFVFFLMSSRQRIKKRKKKNEIFVCKRKIKSIPKAKDKVL